MTQKIFKESKELNLSQINKDILEFWKREDVFKKNLKLREGAKQFIFYEGPPSANGTPGIHHVISRTIKDIFCRFKTMEGYRVERKAGWDTHGLPVEIGVEKSLGIKKDDIGKKISIEEYNNLCKKDVMKYTKEWEHLTDLMGFWIDMENPYITYENKYIETLWWALKQLYNKGLLYKGYTIQPYSPAAGTGLSTHELNQPGCYKMVKDTSVTALFKILKNKKSEFLYKLTDTDIFMMAWTTTPWTLPSNTALAVGKDIEYSFIYTLNPYSGTPISVILATDRIHVYFEKEMENIDFSNYEATKKKVPYKIIGTFKGSDLADLEYEQLIKWHQPKGGKAFIVIIGDFVSTEEGTGVVHIAPSFGADDFRMAKQYGLGTLTLVDKQGKFIDGCGEFSNRYVKLEYEEENAQNKESVDVGIARMLIKENKVFKVEKYEHSYPHCWRTDKPILYYPLEAWFIKTTAVKERMIELNKTINWQPPHTGFGRFGQWLENLVDWNLSRSRFWGTPLPIWATKDYSEVKCIGSVAELKEEIEKSVAAGLMKDNPLKDFIPGDNSNENYNKFDLHRPYIDKIVLVASNGEPMYREPDLIDVWFDSGAMPYAQLHYPFEHKDDFQNYFPADFIAEGVDQTRGWFFTLHALSTMLFDSIAFKNIVSNGLVLDKNGNKMSKRLGNVIDPFEVINKYGADVVRWYMMTNSHPWENIKFNINELEEVVRKFFSTLHNTYSFFALYANLDNFTGDEPLVPFEKLTLMDKWILSVLNTLIIKVTKSYKEYNPTDAGRLIEKFVIDDLSNWYVRLNRKRYWRGEIDEDKLAAFQTLYQCLGIVAKLIAPIAPFYSEYLYQNLNLNKKENYLSVHDCFFPQANENYINKTLEQQMEIAQKVTSLILSLRKKANIKVRQPLQKVLLPAINKELIKNILYVKDIILSETNIKELEIIDPASGIIVKKVKPNYKLLGTKLGSKIKLLAAYLDTLSQEEIMKIESQGFLIFKHNDEEIKIDVSELEITTIDMPGWLVASDGTYTVALDVTITEELKLEGIARELVNKIQNIRKEQNFNVTDRIKVYATKNSIVEKAILKHENYIKSQTLANEIKIIENMEQNNFFNVELDKDLTIKIKVIKF
ncbi:MAG: isoleucine--tRNA ligase [Bacteroidales bacterium]|nr:isoleucine--tRNA ligase [Bacteroidales bacterium]